MTNILPLQEQQTRVDCLEVLIKRLVPTQWITRYPFHILIVILIESKYSYIVNPESSSKR